jgi:hypothetical protein
MTVASRKSLSALRTQARVLLFIENFALGRNLRQKRLTFGELPFHVVRRADNDVQREWRIDGEAYFYCLVQLIVGGHDDQDIDVAVGMRRAIGMRAEKKE